MSWEVGRRRVDKQSVCDWELSLTLKSDQGTFTPVGAQGGFHGPPEKTTFTPEFCIEIYTIYVQAIKKSQFCKKKTKQNKTKHVNVVPFQNGGQITDFYFVSFQFWQNFEKPLSQSNFFNEIWLKEGEYE